MNPLARRKPTLLALVAVAALFAGVPNADAVTISPNTSGFNGTDIEGGDWVWFNSVFKASGLDENVNTSVYVTNASLNIVGENIAGSPLNLNLALPNSRIDYSTTATQAGTTFDQGTNTWVTTIPLVDLASTNVFLSGFSWKVPTGGLGGGADVTWTLGFSTDTPGVTGQWKWGAAVYENFTNDYNALGVKPVDGDKQNPYANSHHAGTPENFIDPKPIGGARGGGSSNFTGSYSGTKSVTPDGDIPAATVPEPGTILLLGSGIAGAALRNRRKRAQA